MIKVDKLCKRYKLYRAPIDRLKEIFTRRSHHHLHHALDEVSFEVPSGTTLGIIGHNGAGKSTLLKLLSGVSLPDSGEIQTGGRITGLLELGTGFNFELSGLHNIDNNGLLIGMSQAEIDQRRQAIIDFSELGDFIHEPLKTYSSGMVMRLAFAIAIHAEPDTFLVDEALSVGDAHFQQKCFRRIREFRASGGSIILVSHDLNAVKMLCDQALLLDHGKVVDIGDPEQVVNRYNFLVARQSDQQLEMKARSGEASSYGNGEAEILTVELFGHDSGAATVSSGETCTLRIRYRVHQDLPALTIGLLIRDRFGQDIFGTNSHLLSCTPPSSTGVWSADFSFELNIGPGKYTITAALHADENHLDTCYHWCDAAASFDVAGVRGPLYTGLCRLQTTLDVQPVAPPD